MLSFLKRRWMLLICAVALLPLSIMDGGFDDLPPSSEGSLGVRAGNLQFHRQSPFAFAMFRQTQLHGIQLGALPDVKSDNYELRGPGSGNPMFVSRWSTYILPLWLPLSAVVGCILFRELRWRGKRAKLAEASPMK